MKVLPPDLQSLGMDLYSPYELRQELNGIACLPGHLAWMDPEGFARHSHCLGATFDFGARHNTSIAFKQGTTRACSGRPAVVVVGAHS
jgi:hypothetical protein